WMPLPRATLYGLGENVHIAVWPGSVHNTKDITRFIARESRSYAISVSTLLNRNQIPDSVPHVETLKKALPEVLSNGGSCVAGPDGEWLMEPVADEEGIFYQELNLNRVREERQNFDPSGHYSRPDVTSLQVNRKRQSVITIHDE
ncbi:MAG: carbon-nitrogen hydrolase family protein, partial [Balneolaceae bacterium]